MKSSIEIEDDVFKVLDKSSLAKSVTGKIYKSRTRPSDSVKEDITIKTLANSIDEDVQSAFVNVNIYVADKPQGKSYEVDNVRLRTLARLAIDVLHRGGKSFDFRTTVDDQNVFEVSGSVNPEHYINIKVKYQFNNS